MTGAAPDDRLTQAIRDVIADAQARGVTKGQVLLSLGYALSGVLRRQFDDKERREACQVIVTGLTMLASMDDAAIAEAITTMERSLGVKLQREGGGNVG